MKGPTPGRRNGRVKLRGSLMPEVRRRAGAAPDDVATVRRQRAGCASKAGRCRETEPVVEAPILVSSPETGGYGLLGCSVLIAGQGRLDRPSVVRAGEAVWSVAVAARRCLRGRAGRRPCLPVDGERGKRPGGARRTRCVGSWAGAPSAVAAGAWRRTRSSPRSGKPTAWRRGPVSTQHVWMGGGRR